MELGRLKMFELLFVLINLLLPWVVFFTSFGHSSGKAWKAAVLGQVYEYTGIFHFVNKLF